MSQYTKCIVTGEEADGHCIAIHKGCIVTIEQEARLGCVAIQHSQATTQKPSARHYACDTALGRLRHGHQRLRHDHGTAAAACDMAMRARAWACLCPQAGSSSMHCALD